jgi:hypothetical protein
MLCVVLFTVGFTVNTSSAIESHPVVKVVNVTE